MDYKEKANSLRKDILHMLYNAQCGHPGGSLSCVEIMIALYYEVARIDPKNPNAADRDRIVLSKGHACPTQYAILADLGFFPRSDLWNLRQIDSHLQGHPDMLKTPGIDTNSGSLGQGVAIASGMALAAKYLGKSYHVYAITGDGESQEGLVWEAAMSASHYRLDNLTVIMDYNGLQIDGNIADVCSPYPIDKKFEAFNFHVIADVDAHDFDALAAAFKEARETKGMPTAIIAKSTKGKGVSFMENQAGWHGTAPNDEQYKIAMEDLERIGATLCQK